MFARVKKSGKYQYLQIVENRKEKGKVKQRVISTIGNISKTNGSKTGKGNPIDFFLESDALLFLEKMRKSIILDLVFVVESDRPN